MNDLTSESPFLKVCLEILVEKFLFQVWFPIACYIERALLLVFVMNFD